METARQLPPACDNPVPPTMEQTRLKSLALPNFRLPLHDATPIYSMPRLRNSNVPFTGRADTSNFDPPRPVSDSMDATAKPRKDRANQNWDAEEDAKIIELRSTGMTWSDVASKLPGRTKIACRLHYQHCLEKKGEWDDHKKTRLAKAYEIRKEEIWQPIASELGITWRNAEAMHWVMGERGMARRANSSPSPTLNPILAEHEIVDSRPPIPHRQPPTSDQVSAQTHRSERGELASPSTLLLRATGSSKVSEQDGARVEGTRETSQRTVMEAPSNSTNHKRSYDRCSSEGSKCSQDSYSDNGVDGYVWVTRKRSRDEGSR